MDNMDRVDKKTALFTFTEKIFGHLKNNEHIPISSIAD
jgi:hypothetical protein